MSPPAQAQDPTPAQIVGHLNDYRAKIGLPGPIPEEPKWSEACRLHNEYSHRNNTGGHSEDPSLPGYTNEGDWAARNSVLYQGDSWTAKNNPFETAPIHLHQLLNPRIDLIGAAETRRYGCATSVASRNRPAPETVKTYTYPASGATHRSSEVAVESPFTPGEKVGIPAYTRTGPYIYVVFDGPWNGGWSKAQLNSASLTGPSGAVAIKTVDQTTPEVGMYLPIGAEIIPVQPLQPGSTYTATVTATVTDPYTRWSGTAWVPKSWPVSYSWSFKTSAATPLTQAARAARGALTGGSDMPAPRTRRANRPPTPSIVSARVRGANVHVVADVGRVGHVTATLSNRRHRHRGRWRTIDVRRDSIGRVRLVGRVPVGHSWIRVESSDLEHFQPEVDHGPKDNPPGHSSVLGEEAEPNAHEPPAGSARPRRSTLPIALVG